MKPVISQMSSFISAFHKYQKKINLSLNEQILNAQFTTYRLTKDDFYHIVELINQQNYSFVADQLYSLIQEKEKVISLEYFSNLLYEHAKDIKDIKQNQISLESQKINQQIQTHKKSRTNQQNKISNFYQSVLPQNQNKMNFYSEQKIQKSELKKQNYSKSIQIKVHKNNKTNSHQSLNNLQIKTIESLKNSIKSKKQISIHQNEEEAKYLKNKEYNIRQQVFLIRKNLRYQSPMNSHRKDEQILLQESKEKLIRQQQKNNNSFNYLPLLQKNRDKKLQKMEQKRNTNNFSGLFLNNDKIQMESKKIFQSSEIYQQTQKNSLNLIKNSENKRANNLMTNNEKNKKKQKSLTNYCSQISIKKNISFQRQVSPTRKYFKSLKKQTNSKQYKCEQLSNQQPQQIQLTEQTIKKYNIDKAVKYYRYKLLKYDDIPYIQKLQKLLDQNKIFTDLKNPSFSKQYQYLSSDILFQNKQYFLIAPSFQNGKIVHKICASNICQGRIGNCSFIGALTSLTEKYPSFLESRFMFTVNPAHYYAIKLFYFGSWQIVQTDDSFPSINKKMVYAKSKLNQIWINLLQKTIAKVLQGYKYFERISINSSFYFITGCIFYLLEPQKNNTNIFKNKIKQAKKQRYLLTTSANSYMNSLNKIFLNKMGLVSHHAYSFLDIYQIKNNTLVKLRNPWGQYQWKGSWSFNSYKWTEQLRRQLDYLIDPKDGSFFMCWKDFLKYFGYVNICYFNPKFVHYFYKMTNNRRKSNYLKLKIIKKGRYIICIHQNDQKTYSSQSNEYSPSRLIIMKNTPCGMMYLTSQSVYSRQFCKIQMQLQPGQYTLSVKVVWENCNEHDCFLTIYGCSKVQLKLIDRKIAKLFKLRLIYSYVMQNQNNAFKTNYKRLGQEQVQKWKYFNSRDGIGFIKIVNNSEKNFKCKIKFNLINIKPIIRKNFPYEFELLKGTSKVFVFLIKANYDNYDEICQQKLKLRTL